MRRSAACPSDLPRSKRVPQRALFSAHPVSLAPSGLARELSATSLSRSLAGLRFAQSRSAPGGPVAPDDLVGDRETSMVVLM